jgi:hypothetical protein
MNLLQRRTTQPRQLFVRRGLSWAQPWGCPYGRATRRASALVTRGTHPGYSERAGPRAAAVAPSVGNASSGVLFFSALPAGVVSTVRVIVVACRRRVPRAADTAPRLHAARAAVCSMGVVADMAALTTRHEHPCCGPALEPHFVGARGTQTGCSSSTPPACASSVECGSCPAAPSRTAVRPVPQFIVSTPAHRCPSL